MTQIDKDISEMRGEMKYMSRTLMKVEKVLESWGAMMEKQNVANKRILDLEKTDEKIEQRVRKLEDWQIKIVTLATVIATIFGFILNKLF